MATLKSREQLLEEQKRTRADIEKKHGKSVEELYEEREKRVRDAIQLKQPDRVPVALLLMYFPARYVGIPYSAAFYDAPAWRETVIKTLIDFGPDLQFQGAGTNPGLGLEALDPRHTRWPGGALPPDSPRQAIDIECMKEDEYDLFLSDPTDFTLRYLLPRAFGALEPLSRLPALTDRFTQFPGMTPIFTREEFRGLAQTLLKAGMEQAKFNEVMGNIEEDLASLGFPPYSHGGGAGSAPFDTISDFYRGMQGTMTDIYRCPDKLLAACDKILEMRIRRAVPADPKRRGNPKRVFLALHRGAQGFMSKKQFEKFYWPGLKKAMLTTIDLGYVPIPFCEGKYGDRLEYFLELPRGKAVVHLDLTDMGRAKDVLKDHLCIMGNVPSPLLQIGSPQEVEEYCRNLIEVCGKHGGFILAQGSSIDEAKPANIKAMIESVKKYGVS